MSHVARRMLHVARCTLHVTHWTLHVARYMMRVACCIFHFAFCMLHDAWCTLRVARCMFMLHVACCILHVACIALVLFLPLLLLRPLFYDHQRHVLHENHIEWLGPWLRWPHLTVSMLRAGLGDWTCPQCRDFELNFGTHTRVDLDFLLRHCHKFDQCFQVIELISSIPKCDLHHLVGTTLWHAKHVTVWSRMEKSLARASNMTQMRWISLWSTSEVKLMRRK